MQKTFENLEGFLRELVILIFHLTNGKI